MRHEMMVTPDRIGGPRTAGASLLPSGLTATTRVDSGIRRDRLVGARWRAPLIGAIAGCFLIAPGDSARMRLSQQQMGLLALEIVSHTPEYLHWTEGTTFKWVLFPSAAGDNLPALRDKVRRLLEERYVVYSRPEQVPAEKRVRGELGVSYRHGFEFNCSIHIVGKNTFQIDYQDYEAPLAASSQTILYRWLNGRWHVTSQSSLQVS